MTFPTPGARQLIPVLLAAAAAIAAVASGIVTGNASGAGTSAAGKERRGGEKYTIGLFGDMP
jgi:F0F1-type ATP synthase membrane subunit c/vacuolar-type H+-ATPase subunit K